MKTKLLLLLLLANFSIYAQINLVPNAGFETWTGGVPQNWTVANSVTSSTDFASGQYSAKLSFTTVSPKIIAQVPMKAGITYTVKYKYKYVTSNYSGDHPIALNISKTGSATTLSSSTFATNNLWTSKETTFTPDADLSYDLSISVFSFDSAAFSVLIDDVQVYVQGTEQYTLIPDVEFEKRLINLGLDSGANDGKVLTLNIKTVKSLSVDPKIVTDLTGIEDFAALETLTCNGASYYADGSGGDGNLKVLDVSKNLNLISLSCRANKISTIDVSKNTKLIFLDVSGNKIAALNVTNNLLLQRLEFDSTLISSIDISKNLNLDRLDCSSTKITALDLSNNLNLSNLNCSSTKINSIDVSKNILLSTLNVNNNLLTSLDVSKNINLLTLYCSTNLLTAIDVSKNIKLVNFSCFANKLTSLDVSKNTALTDLYCYENQITALDVSKNIALKSFNCSSNKITALDVSKNNALNYFVCSANELTSLNLKNGANTLLKNANVSLALNPKLSCITVDDIAYANTNWADKKDSGTYFSTYDCATTTQILDPVFEDKLIALGIDKDGKNGIVLNSSIASITSLDVSNSSIVSLGGIQGFTALTTLNASGNVFTKIDLSKNTNLNNLNVSNNPALKCIQVADIAATANWTVNKDAAASFSLDCNVYTLIPDSKFEDKLIALGIDKDGKNGKVNTESISGITSLDISYTEIADLTGIQDFVNLTSLKCTGSAYVSPGGGNGKLTKLDLSKNTKLTTLNCSYNQLTSLDLSKNTLLNNVNVSYNRLSAIDITANTAITTLSLNNNTLTSIDLSQNTALLYAYLDINKLSTLDVSKNLSLSSANFSSNVITTLDITKNTALTSLDCSNNKLTSIDLSKNTLLSSLRIYQSGITSLDVSKNLNLKTLYCSSNTLTVLDVTKNTLLSYLDCSYNKIATLDVSKNTALYYLQTSINELTSLDVSKNVALTNLYCSSNKLISLNVKNGKNAMLSGGNINFLNNPALNCIQVDNVDYSKTNWSTQKDETAYFSSLDCKISTNIPDSKFEDKLIALGIDTDGKNGGVLNSSINTITVLNVSNSLITDLTGIQGFTALTTLNTSGNSLLKIDVSKNTALNTLTTSGNPGLICIQVADIAATANWTVTKDAISSFSLDCNVYTLIPDTKFEDKLIALNIDRDGKNGKVKTESIAKITNLSISGSSISDLTGIQDFTALVQLMAYNNTITQVDLSKNQALTYFDLGNNQITYIDLSKNTALTSFDLGNNKISTIDLTKNANLTAARIGNNKLTAIDITKNAKLGYLLANGNSLVAIDISNNTELYQLWVQDNQIRTLDLSKSTKLSQVIASNNKLVNLNLKNGANTLLDSSSGNNGGLNFTKNPDLTCIQVDDVAFSNTNWAAKKDATAIFSATACPVVVPYTLIPDSNFEDKLIALQIDKDGKNGKVATMSVISLTSLNVSNSNIADLTGIEDFTSLTSLESNNNQLTTINISKNLSLTKLNVSKNKLSILNVASHTLLSNLDCSNNEILVLDVSKNTKLTYLSTSFNKLKTLDVSKNTILKEFDCAGNDLYNLNLKNGNNVNMQNMIFGNLTKNPNLLCIQVDDAAFSNDKWIAKDATATYSTEVCEINYQYTLIPDPNFENVLIAKGIDIDGKNGKVRTESIANVTQLNAYDLTNKITDLTGIQDFTALEYLDCSNGALTTLDLSKNLKLKTLYFRYNKLTSLDLSKNTNLTYLSGSDNLLTTIDLSQNTALTTVYLYNNKLTAFDASKNTALATLSVYSNQLTSLEFSKNTALKTLDVSSNLLTSIDVSKNIVLTSFTPLNNKLTSLDISSNVALTSINVSNNQLTILDTSKNLLLTSINAENNQLTSINVSKNTALTILDLSTNQIASLDLSQNILLKTVDLSSNLLVTFDISKNPALTSFYIQSNKLTSLDLRNGKNTLLTTSNVYFYGNTLLYCILVDDVIYANTNWSNRKDAIATYNTECTGELILPANNFAIETKGESCLGENNGEISIVAKATFAYAATVNDKPYTFTNNSLKIAALAPGVYKIKITIPDVIFEQNFNITIAKGATIAGKSSITSKKVDVEITEGTAPFTIFVDGAEQFQTTDSNFSIELTEGGLIEVATSKACEGVYAKKIKTTDILGTVLSAYPNPTSGVFEIEIPTDKNEVTIEIYNFGGQLVSRNAYVIENGTAKLNLVSQPSGIYAAKIYLETPEYIKIIKK